MRRDLVNLSATLEWVERTMYLTQLFERKASASPDALAIACAARRINYRELNLQADLIAEGLQDAGVTAGCLVGVLLDRSPEMVAGLLGIWKAGGGYVPLDPAASVNQISFVLEDAAPPFVLTRKSFLPGPPASACPTYNC